MAAAGNPGRCLAGSQDLCGWPPWARPPERKGTPMTPMANAQRPLGETVVRGGIGGLVAGAAFIGVTMWFVTSLDMPAESPLLGISTIVLGSGALEDGSANAALGLVVHTVLSVVYGVVFAILATRVRSDGLVSLLGAVYGALLFVVNFLILAPLSFTAFEGANKPFEFVVHVFYGSLLALAFLRGDTASVGTSTRHQEPVSR